MAKILFRISTSQVDTFDLQTGRIRQLRNRQFVNNCVSVPWTDTLVLVTGFDSPDGDSMLLDIVALTAEKTGKLVQARKFHCGVKFGNRVFVMGGNTHQLDKLRTCESFDGRRWTKEADMVECRSGFSAVTTPRAIYALGDNTSRSIEKFDGISWRRLPFSLHFDTQNLCTLSTASNEMLVIGGGSRVTGSSDAVRMQDLDSDLCTLLEKLSVPDYFRSPPVEYEGSLYCIGMKGIHERTEAGWRLHSKESCCKFCERWRCDGLCKWLRVRVLCSVYIRTRRLALR